MPRGGTTRGRAKAAWPAMKRFKRCDEDIRELLSIPEKRKRMLNIFEIGLLKRLLKQSEIRDSHQPWLGRAREANRALLRAGRAEDG